MRAKGGAGNRLLSHAPCVAPPPPPTHPQDQAARALFLKSELKLAGFYNALANDAQFVKAATLAVFQQLTVDQAFANEVYALSSAYVQTQVPVVESKPQCKRFF